MSVWGVGRGEGGVIEQLNNHVKTLKEYVSAKHANVITVDKVLQNQALRKNELRKRKKHKQKVRLAFFLIVHQLQHLQIQL